MGAELVCRSCSCYYWMMRCWIGHCRENEMSGGFVDGELLADFVDVYIHGRIVFIIIF